MGQPIQLGDDAVNAKGAIKQIIGDDSLYDKLADVASAEGPESDARPTIIQWLRDNGYAELADKYDSNYTQNDAGVQQQPDAVANQQQQSQAGQTGGEGTANPSPEVNPAMQESTLWDIRRLAGLNQ